MPISEPENVSISPNAINSEWWISPTGGVTNPATSIVHPKMHNAKAVVNCKRFMLTGLQSLHASSAKCTDTGFCTWFDCGSSLDLVPW